MTRVLQAVAVPVFWKCLSLFYAWPESCPDIDNVPIVLPFVHTGMQDVMLIAAKLPRIGKTVTVLVSDPIYFDDILNLEENRNVSRGKIYDAVSARICDKLQKLKAQVERLVIEQSLQIQNYPAEVTARSAGILRQVDRETLVKKIYTWLEDYLSSAKPNLSTEKGDQTALQERGFRGWNSRTGYSWQGGISSRYHGYMGPTDLMGFAARGLLYNGHANKNVGVNPLKALNDFRK